MYVHLFLFVSLIVYVSLLAICLINTFCHYRAGLTLYTIITPFDTFEILYYLKILYGKWSICSLEQVLSTILSAIFTSVIRQNCSRVVAPLLLIHCLLLLLLFCGSFVFGPCFVFQYLVSFLVLQSSL